MGKIMSLKRYEIIRAIYLIQNSAYIAYLIDLVSNTIILRHWNENPFSWNNRLILFVEKPTHTFRGKTASYFLWKNRVILFVEKRIWLNRKSDKHSFLVEEAFISATFVTIVLSIEYRIPCKYCFKIYRRTSYIQYQNLVTVVRFGVLPSKSRKDLRSYETPCVQKLLNLNHIRSRVKMYVITGKSAKRGVQNVKISSEDSYI